MSLSSISGITQTNITDLKSVQESKLENTNFQEVLNSAIENGDNEQLKEACMEFESYFLNMMFKSMRSTVVSGGGMFEKSNGEILFQEMLDEEMCNQAAKGGGIGLADMMYKQLTSQANSIDYKG